MERTDQIGAYCLLVDISLERQAILNPGSLWRIPTKSPALANYRIDQIKQDWALAWHRVLKKRFVLSIRKNGFVNYGEKGLAITFARFARALSWQNTFYVLGPDLPGQWTTGQWTVNCFLLREVNCHRIASHPEASSSSLMLAQPQSIDRSRP